MQKIIFELLFSIEKNLKKNEFTEKTQNARFLFKKKVIKGRTWEMAEKNTLSLPSKFRFSRWIFTIKSIIDL